MANCGCKPGTKENGWHEIVCAACLRKEKAFFAKAVERAKKKIIANKINN
jgi:hypothetical protein